MLLQKFNHQSILKYIPNTIKTYLFEKSWFQVLCLSFKIKAYAINASAILSAFIYSNDPIEAQILLGEMRQRQNKKFASYNDIAGESAAHSRDGAQANNFGQITLSEIAHNNLFKRGIGSSSSLKGFLKF